MAIMAVSDEELSRALASAARIIDRYGDVYWPIFVRLEREHEHRRSRAARLRAHLNAGQARRTVLKTNPPGKDGRS